MRACVYGAGAIGGHLAVRLAKGGAEVSVIARGKHLAAIQANGLEVHAIDGVHKIKVQATDDPRTVGPVDAVFVTVKAPGAARGRRRDRSVAETGYRGAVRHERDSVVVFSASRRPA